MRDGLSLCSCRDRKKLAHDMRAIYRAESLEAAEDRPEESGEQWEKRRSLVVASWRNHREEVVAMSALAPEVRRLLSTTNAIDNLNLRRFVRARGHLPYDCAVSKLLVPALRNIESKPKAPAAGGRSSSNRKSRSEIGS